MIKKWFAMLLAFTMCAALTPGMDTWAYAEGTAHGDVMYTSTAAAPAAPSGMQWVLTGQNTSISMECAKPEHTHSIENGCYALKSDDSCHVHSIECYTHVHDEGCCSMKEQSCGLMCGTFNCGITYQHVHDPDCIDGFGNTHAKLTEDCDSDACTNIPNRLSCTKPEKECDNSCYDTSTPICGLEAHTHGNCSTVASSYRWQLVDASELRAGYVLPTADGREPAVTPQGYRWEQGGTQTASASLKCRLDQHVHSIAGDCSHTCSGHVHTGTCKTAHVHTTACCMYEERTYNPSQSYEYYHLHNHEHDFFSHNNGAQTYDVCRKTQHYAFTDQFDTVNHGNPGCRDCVYANCSGEANVYACGKMAASHTPDCIRNFTCNQQPHTHDLSCFNIGYDATEWTLVAASFSITCENAANGAVTANKNPAIVGEPVTLTIIPAEDYELDTLTVMQGKTEITVSGTGNTRTFTMPVGDVTVSATFKHICDGDIALVAGQAATCTENGWQDYYQCSVCKTTYADADGMAKIIDLEAWKKGDGKVNAGHSPTYAADGNVMTESCSVCENVLGTVTISAVNAAYTGAPYEEVTHITVTATGTLIDRNWPISYIATSGSLTEGKPVNAGDYVAAVTVEEKGTSLSAGDDFTITPVSIENAVVTVTDTCTYDGTEKKPTSLTVTLNGHLQAGTDFEIVSYSNNINAGTDTANITIRGKGNYEGMATGSFTIAKAVPAAADFIMTPPANLHYTGETKVASVEAASGVTGMGAITVKYSPENPVNNGTYHVLIDVAEGDNYTAVTNLDVGSFAIGQSGSAFSDVKTYLGDAEKNEFTYGQTVTVKGNVQLTGEAPAQSSSLLRAFTAPAERQVALFDAAGTTQLSAAAAVGADGAFVLTYDTTAKLVDPAESVTLMVKYVGDGNTADASTTVSFKLNTKTLTPVSAEAEGREYAPRNTAVSVTAVTLDGIVNNDNDNVSVKGLPVNGTLSSDEADTYASVILPQLTLTGTDAAFYSVSGTEAATNVTIFPKAVAAPIIVLAQTSFVYDGTEKRPAVTAVKDGDDVIPAGEYTVSYSDNVNAGTAATVSIVDVEGGNYTVSGSTTFTITQTQTVMTAQTDKAVYTYGDVITVTGTADVPQPEQRGFSLLRVFAGPSAQQVALYDAGGNQLTDGVDVVNGAYTIPYDTTLKDIVPGQGLTLTVKFVGDANMSDQFAATNSLTLNAKSVAPALGGAVTKAYDGTTAVPAGHALSIRLDGLQGSDSVSVTGSFAYADVSVGTGKTVTASGLTLGGDDARFYGLNADTVSGACGEITRAQIAPRNGALNVSNNKKKTYTYDLSQLLPALDSGRTYGNVSYTLGTISLGSHYSSGASISGSMLSLPIEAVRGNSENVGTVNITITSGNFAFTADAVITVKEGAQIPEIEDQPASASYLQGDHDAKLKVKAKITDGGKLTYQWYSNTANSNVGGTPIIGADGANYKPSTDVVGTMYYYCVVTNTNDKAAGEKTASIVSQAATVTILPAVVVHDADITIIGQPGTAYENVHAKLMPLGSTAPLYDRELTAVAGTSPVQYLYRERAADGLYNLVVTAEEADSHKTVTVTTLIDLQGHDDQHDARLPEADKSSIVDDDSGLGIIAGNVEDVAAGHTLADSNGHLEVTLTTEQGYDPQTEMEDAPKIEQQADEDRKDIEVVLDIDLMLHQYSENGTEIGESNLGDQNKKHLEILIPIDTAGREPEGFAVYRVHNGQLQKLPYGEGDEYFTVDIDGGFIKLYVKRFSSYAIGYGEPIPQAIPDLPKTGDHSQLGAWLTMLALCGAGMIALRSRKRRTE